ncbi:MAG: hypothetical protein OXI87_10400, partial [Albidovulum sp.]|nr:hypothetical protein [Albidovulum sp.]
MSGTAVGHPEEGVWPQAPQGEGGHRDAEDGEGSAARAQRNHRLHRAQDSRRGPVLGVHFDLSFLRPQAEGLTAPFPDVLPA